MNETLNQNADQLILDVNTWDFWKSWGGGEDFISSSSEHEKLMLKTAFIKLIENGTAVEDIPSICIDLISTSYKGLYPMQSDTLLLAYRILESLEKEYGVEMISPDEYLEQNFRLYANVSVDTSNIINLELRRLLSVDLSEDVTFLEKLKQSLIQSKSISPSCSRDSYFWEAQVTRDNLIDLITQYLGREEVNLQEKKKINIALRSYPICTDQSLILSERYNLSGLTTKVFEGAFGFLPHTLIAIGAETSAELQSSKVVIIDPTILQTLRANIFTRSGDINMLALKVRDMFPDSFNELGIFVGSLSQYFQLASVLGLDYNHFDMDDDPEIFGSILERTEDFRVRYIN